mgnify:CR=1 FL=1
MSKKIYCQYPGYAEPGTVLLFVLNEDRFLADDTLTPLMEKANGKGPYQLYETNCYEWKFTDAADRKKAEEILKEHGYEKSDPVKVRELSKHIPTECPI